MAGDSKTSRALLNGIPLFSSLTESDLDWLAELVVVESFDQTTTLYEAGSATDGLYFLVKGKASLRSSGNTQVTRDVYPGEMLGEEAPLNIATRQNSAYLYEKSSVLFLTNSQVQILLQTKPEVAKTLKVILQSRHLHVRVNMPWLQEGERINLMTRKHPVFLLLNTATPILSFAAAMFLISLFTDNNPFMGLVLLLAAFGLCILWLAWNIHNWANDYYLITNKRMVWVERISGFYDSRQEAPLGTLLSVGIKTTQFGAIIGYSDVIVRTFIGDIRFNRVAEARAIGKLIEVYWSKSKLVDLDEEAEVMRKALRKKFGTGTEVVEGSEQKKTMDTLPVLPVRETSFFEWLFADFLKIRYEVGGITTYRKHWFVLIKKIILPLIGSFFFTALIIAVLTRNFVAFDYTTTLVLGSLGLVTAISWLLYVYMDWRNDVFQLTPNQIIDIDRKPFGRESRRSAPLDNILSIEYERNGIIPMLFNFGTVFITVGNTQLTFNDVYQPSHVQQDIFNRMGKHTDEKQKRLTEEERERIVQWLKVYREENLGRDDTELLRNFED